MASLRIALKLGENYTNSSFLASSKGTMYKSVGEEYSLPL